MLIGGLRNDSPEGAWSNFWAARMDGEPDYANQVEGHRLQARVHESRLQELIGQMRIWARRVSLS